METNKDHIYLDNQATTCPDSRVLNAMMPYFTEHFGNPSSEGRLALVSRIAMARARDQVASLINCLAEEIYFTSGATESLNWALRGIAEKAPDEKKHIVTSSIEHSAVLRTCEFLENEYGFEVTKVKPAENGIVSVVEIEKAITQRTLLVTVQHVNNEIGTIQPIRQIGNICRDRDILFLVDGAQSVGKIPCDVGDLKIDLLAASGHKLYAPKGIGFLFIREEIKERINPLFYGGGQENAFRSGTSNVPYIVALGEACRIAESEMQLEADRISFLRNEFLKVLQASVAGIVVNGCMRSRLPGNLNFSVCGILSDVLIRNLSGISLSRGSACNAEKKIHSHVLRSITHDKRRINSAVRVGIGRFNTLDEIHEASERIAGIIKEILTSNAQF